MRRKIIKQGSGSCTVFLPLDWVRQQGLGPGDEVEMEAYGKEIRITRPQGGLRVQRFDCEEGLSQEELRSIVASAYKAGADEIILTGKVPVRYLEGIAHSLTGMEILAMTGKEARLRCFVKTDPESRSGYLWSSRKGAQVEIYSGTVCSSSIITRSQRPITLVLVWLKELLEKEKTPLPEAQPS